MRSYVISATALLAAGVVLLAAAAPHLHPSLTTPAGGPGVERAAPHARVTAAAGGLAAPPVAPVSRRTAKAAALPSRPKTAPEPAAVSSRPENGRAAHETEAARARLTASPLTPAREVDRWAVRLADRRAQSNAALARYARYRDLIADALRRHRLPADLAFLPWVESEWSPTAQSHAGAMGMWQFMKGTARLYGLEVSSYVDERRDPVRSTEAAARHLSDLRRDLGDWHKALAAYNAGTGRVRRSVGEGNHAFWTGRGRLPKETRNYVPHVLAAARIGRNPEVWGLHTPQANPLSFRQLWTDGGTDLADVARRVGATEAEVIELNPHLIRGRTPPGRRWPVRVPLASRSSMYGV